MRTLVALVAVAGCVDLAAPDERSDAMRMLYDEALPYYLAGEAGTFAGTDGATIAYQAFRAPDRTRAIVLAPGRTEGSHTFMQLAYDLRDSGYDLYVIDHRGQGASSRLTDDPLKGHVDRFADYVADYEQFVREVVQPQGYDALYAVGHSMGGAITIDYARSHPETFSAIALSAPMLLIDTSPLSEKDTLWYASSVPPEDVVPGGYDWTTAPKFIDNYLTTDPHQFEALYETDNIFPERRVGPATFGWTAESLRAGQSLRAGANQVVQPVLMFQAGADRVVVPEAQTTFCAASPQCELVTFPTARHELFFADATVRGEILERMLGFFAAR